MHSSSERRLPAMVLVVVLLVPLLVALLGPAAMAQDSTPETFPEPEEQPTVERDIDETDDEFRMAVIGLIGVAVVTFLLIVFYWVHTGRSARRRFAAEHGAIYDDDGYLEYPETDEVGFYEQPPGW